MKFEILQPWRVRIIRFLENKNNNILLQFKQTPGNLESYIEFIHKCCTNSNIKKNISAIEKSFTHDGYIMSRNLRMTSVELKDVVSK